MTYKVITTTEARNANGKLTNYGYQCFALKPIGRSHNSMKKKIIIKAGRSVVSSYNSMLDPHKLRKFRKRVKRYGWQPNINGPYSGFK